MDPGDGAMGANRAERRKRWDAMYRDGGKPWDRGRVSPFLSSLARGGWRPPGPVLEVGCGGGADARYLARRGFTVVAVDISGEALALACRRLTKAGVRDRVQLLRLDVLALGTAGLAPFPYAYDRACLNTLPPELRGGYAASLAAAVAPGGVLGLWTMSPADQRDGGPHRLPPLEVAALFKGAFRVVRQTEHFPGRTNGDRSGAVHWRTVLLRV
ncbi:methyltransferase domain-containing protein [bacterium]|nr:methyltransferase domain-containing protein [bacterium]